MIYARKERKMSDIYKEYMVKRASSKLGKVMKGVCIALAAVSFILLSSSIIGIILVVVFGVLAYVIHLHSDIEYEYLYVDKELSVDKIMAKSKRKHVDTFLVEQMEVVAPIGSYHLDGFKHKDSSYKLQDFTSKSSQSGAQVYVIYCNNSKKILIEADENFMKAMHMNAPRIVHMNEG